MATYAAHPAPLARAAIPTPSPKARAQCGSPARWDLCGGRAEPVSRGPSLPRQADFLPCSFGFRPKRSQHDALQVLIDESWSGRRWALETDVASCFEAIPHSELMSAIEERISDRHVLKLLRAMLRAGVMQDGAVHRDVAGTPQGSAVTAPTQKVTWLAGACGGGDRVADGDLFVVAADEHFADDEPQDALLFLDVQLVEPVGEAAEEAFERVGELEVGLGVVELCLERVELGAQRGLALAQGGGAGAEFLVRDELFLVGLDQASDRALGAVKVTLERLAAAGGGVLGAQRGESAVDLGAHERRVLEQSSDLAPHERVELVGANRTALADAPADVPPGVLADAAVVGDPLVARARARAVAGVAALAADEHALQQRQLLGVAPREARVLDQAGLRELEGLLGDDRRHRDQRPLLGRLVVACEPAAMALTARSGGARRLAVPLAHLGLPERGLPAVGGVAQHRPHGRAVPHRLALPGAHATVGQPPSELADRGALLHVAGEHVAHDLRLELVDFPVRITMLCFLDVSVSVRRGGQHGLRAAARAVQLPAAGALADLRALVLGDHPLELAQQLVLGRAAALGLLGEADLDAGALELFEQQHLVGVAAREAVGRVTEQHLEAALGGAVAQTLERRPGQRRTGEPFVLEHQVLRDQQPALGGKLTQPDGLALDRLVLALALRGHPCVDRRHPARPHARPPGHVAHHHPSDRCPSRGAARAPRSRMPAPAERWPADQRRTRSQRALPPRRSWT